jgi:hypothetical protein
LECDEVFLVGPVLPISFNWNRKTGLPTLALRTFAFISIRAVTAVYVQTVTAFENPNQGVVISAALIRCPEELLTISVDVAGPFHATRFKRKACELGRGKSRDQRPETRDQKSEDGGRRTEVRGQRPEEMLGFGARAGGLFGGMGRHEAFDAFAVSLEEVAEFFHRGQDDEVAGNKEFLVQRLDQPLLLCLRNRYSLPQVASYDCCSLGV